ncbi:hypothetical protein ACFLT4_06710 [Chloroflexota bacterium]
MKVEKKTILTPWEQVSVLYDPQKMAEAEGKQTAKLQQVRIEWGNNHVQAALKRLKEAVRGENISLVLPVRDSVETRTTLLARYMMSSAVFLVSGKA